MTIIANIHTFEMCMRVLEAGNALRCLRFAPDGIRLLFSQEGKSFIDIWNLATDDRLRVELPDGKGWQDPGELAVLPDGESAIVAVKGRLLTFDFAKGQTKPLSESCHPERVAVDHTGQRMLLLHQVGGNHLLYGYEGTAERWQKPSAAFNLELAGFFADRDRFVTVDEQKLRIHSFSNGGEEIASSRYASTYIHRPTYSPDGQQIMVTGSSTMYLYDLNVLGKPKRVCPASVNGEFRSFAFHPNGNTIAVIHKGPSLVKLYDLETLKLKHKLNWKLGPLTCVAYSPDGKLGAAGSERGQIVLWDVDE